MGLTFNWEIRFGDMLTLISAFGVIATFLYNRGSQERNVGLTLEALATQLAKMESEFKTFSEALREIAVQKVQIALLMKWYDELRRGIGKIDQ